MLAEAPRIARAHELRGQALAFQNRDAAALAAFRKAAALGLESAQLHYNASILLRRLGRSAEADREAERSAELDRQAGVWR